MKTMLPLQSSILAAALTVLAQILCFSPPPASAQYPLPDDFDPGANRETESFAVQADGKILVGGYFSTLGGQSCNHLRRR